MSADGGGIPPPVRVCRCGERHSLDSWLALPLAGHAGRRMTPEDWEALELRRCRCGEVLSLVVRWEVSHG